MNGSWVRIPLALPAFSNCLIEMISPIPDEVQRRDQVLQAVLSHVREDRRIFLPPFDPNASRPSDQFALQSVGLEPNEFGGSVSEFRYQFEGEEDLLHLIVTRTDGSPLTPMEGQEVAAFLLPDLPSSLMWLKPGDFTQHFYFGHDELLSSTAGGN
ncbi:MAG: hypothetical protein H7Y17_05835 [Chlorobia bacterium]|nr:hypothetical protein [Fimbriimonadaceae bacterium]